MSVKVVSGDTIILGEVPLEGANFTPKTDLTVNESSKTLTVPAGKVWVLQFLSVKLITTATGGNRQMRVEIGDGTDLWWFKDFGAVQAASLTRYYYAASDHPDDTSFDADDRIRMQLEAHILPPGWTVKVWDSAAIDPTADDMEVRLLVDERGEGAML